MSDPTPVSRVAIPNANGANDATPHSAGARSRNDTRARLLESGLELFAEHGLHGVTSHDIARRAGVAAGTFYLHFENKRALFREIARQAIAELRGCADAARLSPEAVVDPVRTHAAALVRFAGENRATIRILFSGDADAAAVEADVLNDLADSIAETRRKRRMQGDLAPGLDPAVLSQALVGMWARVFAWWCEDPTRADEDTLIETLTRIQQSGTDPI